MTERRPAVRFRDELPVPTTNIHIYEQIYVLEQWFRRVAYASLMARYGSAWKAALPPGLLAHLKRRLRQLEGRIHLHCENSTNAIWLLTLEELREVLLANGTWAHVKAMTGLPRRVLDGKLNELREIRNVVGHSRATTPDTAVIVMGLATGLRPGIACFKEQLLYPGAGQHIHLETETSDDLVPSLYADLVHGNDWSSFQPMLSESQYFYSLTRLPTAPFDRRIALNRFLAEMTPCEEGVLAVLVNMSGDEFTLTWPKAASGVEHDRIMRFFFRVHADAWTETEYSVQSVRALCDPRFWFYGNTPPADE